MAAAEYTLRALAKELDPATFTEWQTARDDQQRAILRGLAGPRNADHPVGSVLRYLPAPSEADIHARRGMSALLTLQRKVMNVLRLPGYEAYGTRPDLSRGPIPGDAAGELQPNLFANTLRTSDGFVWRDVTVRRLTQAGPLVVPPKFEAWYRARVKDFVSRNEMASREDDERAARVDFLKLPRRRDIVRKAREMYAPDNWQADGPKVRKR